MIDLEHLFKLRLVVARQGEIDISQWWNTKGTLGQYGATAIRRGLPRTHAFAQTRIVFSVAQRRCEEFLNSQAYTTLWNLPASIEDELQSKLKGWTDEGEKWLPFFEKIKALSDNNLIGNLQQFDLVSQSVVDAVSRLRRSGEGRLVHVTGYEVLCNDLIAVLAAGFSRGDVGKLVVPYVIIEDGEI